MHIATLLGYDQGVVGQLIILQIDLQTIAM